jgi:hypothetical protein
MNKMKKAVAILSFGLGMSAMLPSIANATPMYQACVSFASACINSGDQFACERWYRNGCSVYDSMASQAG